LADPERPPAAFAPNRIGRRAAITGLAASAAVVSGFAVWRWARAISAQVRKQIEPETRSPRRVAPEAHETYLKAYASIYQGPLGIPRSLDLFRRTLELDPENDKAHAGLAEALCFAGIFSWRPTEETYPEARKMALRALELDANNASAHNVLADVKKGYDWDLTGAEAEYRRALELNPSHVLTRLWFAEMWSLLGKFDDAIAESRRAGALDLAPQLVNAWWWQGLAHAGKQDFSKALECLRRAEAVNPGPMTLGYMGHVLALARQRAQALEILGRLRAMSATRYVGPVDDAAVHAGLGDLESGFTWLETAFQRRNHGVHVLRTPLFDGFRRDSRYENFLRRTGVPGHCPILSKVNVEVCIDGTLVNAQKTETE